MDRERFEKQQREQMINAMVQKEVSMRVKKEKEKIKEEGIVHILFAVSYSWNRMLCFIK